MIEIGSCNRTRWRRKSNCCRLLECALALSQKDRVSCREYIRYCKIGKTIPVEVANRGPNRFVGVDFDVVVSGSPQCELPIADSSSQRHSTPAEDREIGNAIVVKIINCSQQRG